MIYLALLKFSVDILAPLISLQVADSCGTSGQGETPQTLKAPGRLPDRPLVRSHL